jgi:hypothetical protein
MISAASHLRAVLEVLRFSHRMSRREVIGMLALARLTEAEADGVIAAGLESGAFVEVGGDLREPHPTRRNGCV